jgi:menaquinone-dependent protoporphyrinogen oxidase
VGHTVTVKKINEAIDLNATEGLILGGPIRMNKIAPDLLKFAVKNQDLLMKMKVACFSVGTDLKNVSRDFSGTDVPNELREIASVIRSKSSVKFAGVMNYSLLSFPVKLLITKLVKAPEGDFRNWNLIAEWATFLNRKVFTNNGTE